MSSTRLDELRMVDPVLSTISQSYSNASMVADFLFPNVQVDKMKGKIPVFGKRAFQIMETDRAIRAQSNRISPEDITLEEFETIENDVEMAIDYLEEEEASDYFRYEQKVAKDLIDILLLGREKDAADIVQNRDNYAADMKYEPAAADKWDNYTGTGDPIDDIWNAKNAITGKIARYPNTMIVGYSAYQAMIKHPKVLSKVQYSGLAHVTTKILAELIGIPNIHIGLSLYSEDGTTFSDVWTDNAIIAYVDKNEKGRRSEYNPSFGYTFQKKGMPEVDTYFENGGKIKVVRCTDNFCVKVTGQDAAYLINGTNS
jgi:hypothetical protein